MSIALLRSNALTLPLADASVDLIVTSPPYFGLRSYQDGGEHYAGQIGSEATPAEFLDALLAATAEMVRVLKPSGSIWINLGDKYSGGNSGESGMAKLGELYRGGGHTQAKAKTRTSAVPGTRPKSLLGLPWRYAIRCIDELDLILRAEVIWSKPNGLPESVTDRVRRSHEQWFHLVREPRYFSAVDEIREAHALKTLTHRGGGQAYGNDRNPDNHWGNPNGKARVVDPLGKLPGSVWSVPTQPLTVPPELGVDHFAAFPMEWPRRIIRGWSPSGICTACGEGRRPVVRSEVSAKYGPSLARTLTRERGHHGGADASTLGRAERSTAITGYACACPEPSAPTRPSVVLDPFGGTGTVSLVADALGRHGISVDMSTDYCRLARWRTTDPGQRAAAMQVEKPDAPAQSEALFDLETPA